MERWTFINLGLTGLGTTLLMAPAAPAQFMPEPSKERYALHACCMPISIKVAQVL
jgi:hypothetical protein